MVSGAILSGAISALLGSIVGAAVTYYRNSVVSKASSIRALHAELCENRDRLEKEIRRVEGIENPDALYTGFSFNSFSEITQTEPEIFNKLAGRYEEVIIAYRALEALQVTHETSTHQQASVSVAHEEFLQDLKMKRERITQAIESVERLWEESEMRIRLFDEELEDPYEGMRMVRYTKRMEELAKARQGE